MTEHPRGQTNAMTWVNIFEDDEIPRVMDFWRQLAVAREPVQFQARLKRRWKPVTFASAPEDFPTWISAWSYPDMSPEGELVGVCGVMTDVSEQKWSQRLMEQRLAEAVERANLSEQVSISAKQAADSERRFRSLSDLMPVGIWMSDEAGNIIYCNDAYYDIVPSARITGTLDWGLVRDEDMVSVTEAYRQLLEDHTKCSFDLCLVPSHHTSSEPRSEQPAKWISVSAYPELHPDGELKYLVGCLIDISHLKMAEQVQSVRATDALQSKRQLEDFIDMTSHEMRNPLSAILHSAEEIAMSFQSRDPVLTTTIASVIEAANTIIYCTEHSTRIVDDILLVSKIESGLLDISPSVVEPVLAVERAFGMFSGEMNAAHITRSFRVDESFHLLDVNHVHLDMSRVLQVFVNLITNAIKFTRPEAVRHIDVYMKVTLQRPSSDIDKNGVQFLDTQIIPSNNNNIPHNSIVNNQTVYICIEVSDTGCGLTEAERTNLFQRFMQAGRRTHVKYGGTGLGLFISRQLCEMQGGQIGLRSESMRGSTFSFFVAAQRALPHEIPTNDGDSSDYSQQGLRTSSLSMSLPAALSSGTHSDSNLDRQQNQDTAHTLQRQHIILLVEDNLINQKVVAKKLKTNGYEVLVANQGMEALDHIRASSNHSVQPASLPSISLVLLDLEMPVMDGLTCIRRIREMEVLGELRCHMPVIAVTANARQEQIDQAKDAGMDDVVTKPFRIQQLEPLMVQLMKRFPTRVLHD